MERSAYRQDSTNRPRGSSSSVCDTTAGSVRPALVVNSRASPTRGNRGISINFLKRIDEWSIGYPFASRARTFMLGTRNLTSARISSFSHGVLMMSRRALVVLLTLLGCAPGVSAQNERFLGIWELNLAKSTITRGAPPLSEMVVNVSEPGGFRSTLAVVTDRGTSVEIHHYNFDG